MEPPGVIVVEKQVLCSNYRPLENHHWEYPPNKGYWQNQLNTVSLSNSGRTDELVVLFYILSNTIYLTYYMPKPEIVDKVSLSKLTCSVKAVNIAFFPLSHEPNRYSVHMESIDNSF